MLLMFLRVVLSLSLTSYYKRVKVKNKHILNKKAPMILALNHPNAFMDPVVFSLVAYPPKYKYLARGDAFKPGIATYALESIGLAPIFRIQDGGKEGLQKNTETYQRVNSMLSKNAKIMVFAEGLCILERRLRPLKKGVPRMVFGAMDEIQNEDFLVVPIGLNYSNASKQGSTLLYNVGEPIKVSDFYEQYKENPSRTYNQFIKELEPRLKNLITHINNPDYDKLVVELEFMLMRDMCKQQNLSYRDPEHTYEITKQITEKVNLAELNQKEELDELKRNCEAYFEGLNKLGVRDWLINPNNKWQITYWHLFLRIIAIVLALPIIVRGILGNYIPYKATQLIVAKSVKNIEFHSSFSYGIGSFLALFFYLLQFFVVYHFSPNIGWPLLVVLVSFFTGKFTLNFYPFILKTKGLYKAITNLSIVEKLRSERTDVLNTYNKLT